MSNDNSNKPGIDKPGDKLGDKPTDKPRDLARRRFLTVGASVVGGVGAAASAWPFVASMNPSAHAKAIGAPVKVDLSKLKEGEMLREKWRGKPIWIVRRTQEMINSLKSEREKLRDPESTQPQQPEYARNEHRSIKPEYLVLVGICTHLGCAPAFRPDLSPDDLGSSWRGGFFCACHGSRFDLAGRVHKSVPAPKNLEVPPYRYSGDQSIVIGESDEETA